jgi:hypothetical protein
VGAEGLFLGTDYPHRAGGDWGAAGFIDAQSWLTEKEKEMIMGGNVMRVMNFKI